MFLLQLKNCCWQLGSAVSSFTGETQIHNAKGISGYWRVFDFAHQRIPKSRFTVCGALFYGTKVYQHIYQLQGCIGNSLCFTLWHMQNAPTSHRKKLKIFHDISCFLLLHHFMCSCWSCHPTKRHLCIFLLLQVFGQLILFRAQLWTQGLRASSNEKWWASSQGRNKTKIDVFIPYKPIHPLQNFHGWFT